MKEKIKILIICDWYEPSYKAGGPIQSCKNLVGALNSYYQFYILTSDRDLGDAQPYDGIATDQWLKGENDSRWYASPGFMKLNNFYKLLKDVCPDIVYFNSMFSQKYTIMPLWALISNRYAGKIIIAPRGMLQAGAMQRKTFKKTIFLRLFKLMGWNKSIAFHATDEQEKIDILSFFPHQSVIVADNIPGVNKHIKKTRVKKEGELSAVFISRIHPKKNLHFILEILKTYNCKGDFLLDIYGEEDDVQYTAKCKSIAAQLPSNVNVIFNGPLPHNQVFDVLAKHHLFLLPTLGENFGHAIYEAMSSACPVLISNKTPWQSLNSQMAGFDIPLDNSSMYEFVIDKFMKMEQKEYDQWSAGAKKLADQFLQNADFEKKYKILFGQ